MLEKNILVEKKPKRDVQLKLKISRRSKRAGDFSYSHATLTILINFSIYIYTQSSGKRIFL